MSLFHWSLLHQIHWFSWPCNTWIAHHLLCNPWRGWPWCHLNFPLWLLELPIIVKAWHIYIFSLSHSCMWIECDPWNEDLEVERVHHQSLPCELNWLHEWMSPHHCTHSWWNAWCTFLRQLSILVWLYLALRLHLEIGPFKVLCVFNRDQTITLEQVLAFYHAQGSPSCHIRAGCHDLNETLSDNAPQSVS